MIKTQFLFLSSILKTRLDEVYHNVFIAFRIMLNCLDTVASCERRFSKLRLIKTFNRSHMTDKRLYLLVMLSIEALCVRSLDLDDVIKAFACQKTRSKPFGYAIIMIRATKSQKSQKFSAFFKLYETSTNQISHLYSEGISSY